MSYREILVPLDSSLPSAYILPQAELLGLRKQVSLLYAVPSQEGERAGPTPSQKRARADIVRYLKTIEDTLKNRGLKVNWTIRYGDPAEEIAWYVQQLDIDMVIMATHGCGEAYQRALGSVAAEALQTIQVPVVLLRVPEPVTKL